MTLSNINKIIVSEDILNDTFSFLQKYGKLQLESHALWVGKKEGNTFQITDVWYPEQENTSISYEVSEDDEFRINLRLHNENLTIIAQIHTHPGEAFHSCTDNEGSALSLPGSLSVVIPDFGFIKSNNIDCWKVFQYINEKWKPVSKEEVEKTFKII